MEIEQGSLLSRLHCRNSPGFLLEGASDHINFEPILPSGSHAYILPFSSRVVGILYLGKMPGSQGAVCQ
jgi:hypothetical protein